MTPAEPGELERVRREEVRIGARCHNWRKTGPPRRFPGHSSDIVARRNLSLLAEAGPDAAKGIGASLQSLAGRQLNISW